MTFRTICSYHNDLVIPQYHNKNTVPCMKCQYRSALVRDALISKLTDILITNILAIKRTNTDADTDIAAPMNSLLYYRILNTTFQHIQYMQLLHAFFVVKLLKTL